MNSSVASNPLKKVIAGYTPRSQKRAERALRCAPFYLDLFRQMQQASVLLPMIASEAGVKGGFCRLPLSENRVEGELIWLIQVGLLRREVDGQGITDGFRLTPLAKQILRQYPEAQREFPCSTWLDRLQNRVARWFAPLGSLLGR